MPTWRFLVFISEIKAPNDNNYFSKLNEAPSFPPPPLYRAPSRKRQDQGAQMPSPMCLEMRRS